MKCNFEEITPGNFICSNCGWQAEAAIDRECGQVALAVKMAKPKREIKRVKRCCGGKKP